MIIYTTDGSAPGVDLDGTILLGTRYTGPITVNENTTVKAAAYKEVKGKYTVGNIAVQTYLIVDPGSVLVGDITFSPAGGTYTGAQTVTLSCAPGWDGIVYNHHPRVKATPHNSQSKN